jgi:flagellar protein FlaG
MDVSQVLFHRIEATQPQQQSPFRTEAQEIARQRSREETRQVAAAVQQLNQAGYSGPTRELTILLDQKTGRPMVRIVDKETGEVLRQIPPEYVLRLAQEAKERLKEGAA